MNQPGNSWRHLLPGAFLIALGGLFLLDKFFYVNIGRYISTWWPSLLIAGGVIALLNDTRRWVGPLVLITIGVIFQVDRLDLYPWWLMRNLWPLILIGIGAGMIFSSLQGKSSSTGRGPDSGEMLDAFVVLGGLERSATSQNFRGGNATAIFGGMDLDLSRARLAPGENHLKITALFGGVDLRVPAHWEVAVQGTPILGGIEDSRRGGGAAAASPTDEPGPAGRLVVDGFAMFGGIEVKS